MIINSKICCYTTLCSNARFYLKLTNKTHSCIKFILQYTIHGETYTKQSKFLTQGQSSTLIFYSYSTDIYFNVLNYSLPHTPLVYHGHIPIPKNTCYEVRGADFNPVCVEVPC